MFTVLCSCSLSHNDNGNPVVYNIKYSDRNIHQKIEVRNILLKYVCIIAINLLLTRIISCRFALLRTGNLLSPTNLLYRLRSFVCLAS